MTEVSVVKYDYDGKEVYRYQGKLRSGANGEFVVEAPFAMQRETIHGIQMKMGDLFVETYYANRWYNIYEVHDVDDGSIKFWYCNVAFPAQLKDGELSFRDLALDLFVYPDGRQEVLDEDEFEAMILPPEERKQALEGLAQLQEVFKQRFGR
jgi:protein associated with RNAse G/E